MPEFFPRTSCTWRTKFSKSTELTFPHKKMCIHNSDSLNPRLHWSLHWCWVTILFESHLSFLKILSVNLCRQTQCLSVKMWSVLVLCACLLSPSRKSSYWKTRSSRPPLNVSQVWEQPGWQENLSQTNKQVSVVLTVQVTSENVTRRSTWGLH